MSTSMSDSDLRQALLGIWRLIGIQYEVEGAVVKPLGENPQGYLVYTPDGYVFVQFATRAERRWPPRSDLLTLPVPQPMAEMGFWAYCGTFEIREGQLVHNVEFSIYPTINGPIEPRLVLLDRDRLILGTPGGGHVEWQRVH
jgi:Lipocalin-like domain